MTKIKEKSKVKEKEKNIYQSHNLKGFIARWLSDRHLKNNSDFYLAVFNYMKKNEPDLEKTAVTRSMQNYLNGNRKISGRYLEAICNILSITPEDIFNQESGLYQTDANFTKEILSLVQDYSKEIGLTESFISYMKEVIPDSDFPVHAPLRFSSITKTPFKKTVYRRSVLAEAYTSETDSQYQRKIEGKTVTLSRADLQFMLEVQNKVNDYISYLCWQRKEEMRKEEQTALEKMCVETRQGDTIKRTQRALSVEEENEIDRFNHYWYE